MPRALTRTLRRWLYVIHRWIGIVTCLLFAMWFISGVVMMYVAFPSLSDRERLAALPDIAWGKVALSPDAAMAAAGVARYPRDLRLAMVDDTPVYRLTDMDGRRQSISALDGRALTPVSQQQALAIAGHHPASRSPTLTAMIDRDQWSVTARYDPHRPLYRVALGDDAGTELYVSSRSGEIVLDTTRQERIWNWLGAIPHWIYPTVLRKDGALWRSLVLWISGICLIVGISGIWIGILRVRLRHRHASGGVTPYRGWMAWHHLTGLIAGLFILTWMFSGWLSLDPGRVFAERGGMQAAAERYAGHDAPTIAAELPASMPAAAEARFVWLNGLPLIVLSARDGTSMPINSASGTIVRLSPAQLWTAAARLLPEARLIERQIVTEDDAYWYAHHRDRELPVLRAVFDDAAASWFYINPRNGDLLERSDADRRTYRWLYNGLHSLDLPLLLRYRPAWDIVVILLSMLGAIVPVSGIVVGWRYLAR